MRQGSLFIVGGGIVAAGLAIWRLWGKRHAGWLQMPEYKVCVLRDDDHVISRVDLFCDDVSRSKSERKRFSMASPLSFGKARCE
jgi:hypothetical protein